MQETSQFWRDCREQETVIFDGAHGIYNIPNVIKLAMSYGFKDISPEEIVQSTPDQVILDYEFKDELYDEAIEFLNDLLPEGYEFGSTEGGDVGVWKWDSAE